MQTLVMLRGNRNSHRPTGSRVTRRAPPQRSPWKRGLTGETARECASEAVKSAPGNHASAGWDLRRRAVMRCRDSAPGEGGEPSEQGATLPHPSCKIRAEAKDSPDYQSNSGDNPSLTLSTGMLDGSLTWRENNMLHPHH